LAFPDPDMFYTIKCVHSNKVFDVPSESSKPVQQWGSGGVGTTNQQFMLDETKRDQYRLVARVTNAPLQVEKAADEEGARLMQGNRGDTSRNEFRLQRLGTSDKYQIIAVHSGKALQAKDNSKDNGAPIVQVAPGSHESQQFELVDARPTGRTGSIEAEFTHYRDFLGNDLPADKITVLLWFVWRENGVDRSDYRELKHKQKTSFVTPKGSTNIGFEAKYERGTFAATLGTFRERIRLEISVTVGPGSTQVHAHQIDLP
jgi:ricin-type beta-trefoil lectin protein